MRKGRRETQRGRGGGKHNEKEEEGNTTRKGRRETPQGRGGGKHHKEGEEGNRMITMRRRRETQQQ